MCLRKGTISSFTAKQFADKLNFLLHCKKSKLSFQDPFFNYTCYTFKIYAKFLTEKHAYEVDTDSLILSHQLHNEGGMPHESISQAGQHMLLAHQLGADEEKYSIGTIFKSQPF